MDTENESAAADGAVAEKLKKERSKIQFPYADLESAVQVARAINDTYGQGCTADQLSAALGVAAAGGQFQLRISTTQLFGLIERERTRINLTALGGQVIQPQYETQGRVSAFLNVPLYRRIYQDYRGKVLPPDTGLANHMKSLGVAPKQADRARQAFRRSAEQAGLFGFGKDRLVLPPGTSEDGRASSAPAEPTTSGAPAESFGSPQGAQLSFASGSRLHSAISGMLETLPPTGQAWPSEDLKEWVTAFEGVLKVVYRVKGTKPD